MRERVRAYRENVLGKGSSSSFNTSELSDALRNLRAALRNNDKEAARKYIKQYLNLEDKPSNLRQTIKRMHPLSGLSRRESNEFIETLSEQEQKNLERAVNYYESLMDLFKETY